MKKILIVIILLFLSNITFNVIAPDINNISKDDFYLKGYNEYAEFSGSHYLNISFDKDFSISKSDISYKIIGSKEDITVFNDCVDISYNIVGKDISFVGTVKKWGVYSIDIQPIIKDVTVSQFAWWNSSFSYMTGSDITNPMDNTAILVTLANDSSGMINVGTNHHTNWSDVRFVTQDNTTELYHFIAYQTYDFAVFWVNVSDEDYINCYYSSVNPVVNSSFNNPYNTFYFFDNFDNLTLWTVGASGSFSNVAGKLKITNDGSYDYLYYDMDNTSNKYLFGVRQNISAWDSDMNWQGIEAYTTVHTVWSYLEDGAISSVLYDNSGQCVMRNQFSHDGTYDSFSYHPSLDDYYILYLGYDGFTEVYDNAYDLKLSNYNSVGQDNTADILHITTRAKSGAYITYHDWFFVNLWDNVNIPSFTNWQTAINYCEYSNHVVNESPSDLSEPSFINISYLICEYEVLDGSADSLNISIVADNGLFYNNWTSNVVNNSYSLNVMLANFTYDVNYTWYVNITNDLCFVSCDFVFTPRYSGGAVEFGILSYKVNKIYMDMIKGDDDMNIYFDINMLGLILIFAIFVIAFVVDKDEKKNIWKPIFLFLDVPISIAVGVTFLGNSTFSVGWWIGIMMFLFGILLSFAGTYYGLHFGRRLGGA